MVIDILFPRLISIFLTSSWIWPDGSILPSTTPTRIPDISLFDFSSSVYSNCKKKTSSALIYNATVVPTRKIFPDDNLNHESNELKLRLDDHVDVHIFSEKGLIDSTPRADLSKTPTARELFSFRYSP
jgi:hypothetical protein